LNATVNQASSTGIATTNEVPSATARRSGNDRGSTAAATTTHGARIKVATSALRATVVTAY
jgi:hypothetical protein